MALPGHLMRLAALTAMLGVLGGHAAWAEGSAGGARARAAPRHLRETGLYSDFRQHVVSPRNLAYVPQYPLWSDGADKRRWVYLPPGTSIDASRPEAWAFPVGTKFWKEFSFNGRRVETRYLVKQANGGWMYATYAWNEDESDAVLVSDQGQSDAFQFRDGVSHRIPSVSECKICHQGHRSEVLGFGALQLSPDRDPLAVHAEPVPPEAVDLSSLVQRKLLKRFPRELLNPPPRIAAATPTERAALGYLHGNCGGCHNDDGPLASLGFSLRHVLTASREAPERAILTSIGQQVRYLAPGQPKSASLRVQPGRPEDSALWLRMNSRHPMLQMPPLGSVLVDEQAVALISRWVTQGPLPATARTPPSSSAGPTP